MLITDYAVVVLERDDQRQWTVLGQTNDVPGGCRPANIWPIVRVREDDGNYRPIPRSRADGFIDGAERFAYIRWQFFKRHAGLEEVVVVDGLRVEVNGDTLYVSSHRPLD